jgi:hypothetical protein
MERVDGEGGQRRWIGSHAIFTGTSSVNRQTWWTELGRLTRMAIGWLYMRANRALHSTAIESKASTPLNQNQRS